MSTHSKCRCLGRYCLGWRHNVLIAVISAFPFYLTARPLNILYLHHREPCVLVSREVMQHEYRRPEAWFPPVWVTEAITPAVCITYLQTQSSPPVPPQTNYIGKKSIDTMNKCITTKDECECMHTLKNIWIAYPFGLHNSNKLINIMWHICVSQMKQDFCNGTNKLNVFQ